jgi:hypothetical protein
LNNIIHQLSGLLNKDWLVFNTLPEIQHKTPFTGLIHPTGFLDSLRTNLSIILRKPNPRLDLHQLAQGLLIDDG